jgi:hypothetical protein
MNNGSTRPIRDRFEEKFVPEPMSGCFLWLGSLTNKGYGQISGGAHHAPPRLAHRVAYELYVGPIPPGMFVLHKCDVRSCCNPDHLFLGDLWANARDMARKGRGLKSSKGHLFGAYPRGKRWRAVVNVRQSRHHVGTFDTAEEASAAAVAERDRLWKEAGCVME